MAPPLPCCPLAAIRTRPLLLVVEVPARWRQGGDGPARVAAVPAAGCKPRSAAALAPGARRRGWHAHARELALSILAACEQRHPQATKVAQEHLYIKSYASRSGGW